MKNSLRYRIYEIIEKSVGRDRPSKIYDVFMIIVIILSLVPLAFKEETETLVLIDKITVAIFIIDYIFRWATADYKFNKRDATSFIKYPFTPLAIIDLISILPSLSIVSNSVKVYRVLRIVRALRVIRFFKAFRYSKSFNLFANVFKRSKKSLFAVCVIAVTYILVSALVIYNVEPDSFENFFEAIYWATVSLTTIGYGDIYPVTSVGRVITMISSIFGIAVIALPSGIITSGFMTELQRSNLEDDDPENDDDISDDMIKIKTNKFH